MLWINRAPVSGRRAADRASGPARAARPSTNRHCNLRRLLSMRAQELMYNPATVTRAYISRRVCQELIELPHRVGIDSTSRYHPPPRGGWRIGFGGLLAMAQKPLRRG